MKKKKCDEIIESSWYRPVVYKVQTTDLYTWLETRKTAGTEENPAHPQILLHVYGIQHTGNMLPANILLWKKIK